MITRAREPASDERLRSPWYRDGRYVNIDDEERSPARTAFGFLKWRLSKAARPAIPEAGDAPPEVRPLSPEDLAPPAGGMRVAWLGHGSVYVVAPHARLVIDPIFGGPPLVRRLAPSPIESDRLPAPDALLLTHNHFDHLHPRSIEAIRRRAPALRALVPSGLGAYVRRLGIEDTRALEWWQSVEIGGVRITSVPARHWSGRSLRDARQSHWTGFILEAGGRRLIFAGDTAMGRHFEMIAARYPPFDAAVLPIGGYSPRWFMRDRHMDPPEAVAAARILRAAVMLPVHWGTFKLSDEPVGEPPIYAQRAADTAGQPLRLWRPGDVHTV